MGMKVVTKLDLGHNFDEDLLEIIVQLSKRTPTIPVEKSVLIDDLLKEIRQRVRDAYSMGVEQGEKKQAVANKDWEVFAEFNEHVQLLDRKIEGLEQKVYEENNIG